MIKNIKGNLFDSKANIICHQVNCLGVMGAGVAKQIKVLYPAVYNDYENFCLLLNKRWEMMLGEILISSCEKGSNKKIINCFAQKNVSFNNINTDYEALEKCFKKISEKFPNKTIAMPYKIGCGLAGGDWEIVYALIEKYWGKSNNTLEIWELQL